MFVGKHLALAQWEVFKILAIKPWYRLRYASIRFFCSTFSCPSIPLSPNLELAQSRLKAVRYRYNENAVHLPF